LIAPLLFTPLSSDHSDLALPPRSLAMTSRKTTDADSSVRPVRVLEKSSSLACGVLRKESLLPQPDPPSSRSCRSSEPLSASASSLPSRRPSSSGILRPLNAVPGVRRPPHDGDKPFPTDCADGGFGFICYAMGEPAAPRARPAMWVVSGFRKD